MSEQLPMTSRPYVAVPDRSSGRWRSLALGLGLSAIGAALVFGAMGLMEDLDRTDRNPATPPTA